MGAPQEVFAPILDRLRADAPGHFGAREVRFEPVGYDDREFSHVLRLAVYSNGATTPVSYLYVKAGKRKAVEGGPNAQRDRVIRDFETTRRVHACMASSPDLGVVPPVACYPEHLAIVTEQVTGPTLLEHVKTRAAWFPREATIKELCGTLEATGRWIRVFQSTLPPGEPIARDFFRGYIDHRLKKIVSVGTPAVSEQDRLRVLKHIDSLMEQIPASELRHVPVHSDLAMANILVAGNKIVVLDFAMAKTGTALHDLARLYVQLDLHAVKPFVQERVVQRLLKSLLAGYDPLLTESRPLFRLLELLHRVNHVVTLLYQRPKFLEAAYNRMVLQRHYRWLSAELERRDVAPELA